MNTATMRHFTPFHTQGDRVILAAPEVWRQPLEWQRNREFLSLAESMGKSVNDVHRTNPDALKSPVNVLLPDLFAEPLDALVWGPNGAPAFVCDNPTLLDFNEHTRMRFSDVVRKCLAIIDSCSLLTFWLPTRHPERVRERWPTVRDIMGPTADCEAFGFVPATYKNVRLGWIEPPLSEWNGTLDGYWWRVQQRDDAIARFDDLRTLAGGLFVMLDGTVEVLDD